eukprot:355791-Chlamydomonas_euryale.AAC.8
MELCIAGRQCTGWAWHSSHRYTRRACGTPCVAPICGICHACRPSMTAHVMHVAGMHCPKALEQP